VELSRKFDQRLAGLGLHVRGVDHGKPAQGQTLGHDLVQECKRFFGHGLIVLVIADHATASVRRENLGGQEVLAGKRTLAGAAGTDQDDERQIGDGDLHCYSVISSGRRHVHRFQNFHQRFCSVGRGAASIMSSARRASALVGSRASTRIISRRPSSSWPTKHRARPRR
jgi:hypothetical protein